MTKTKIPTEIEQVAVADLLPYARNSRTHSEEQIEKIAKSIREFGFTNPILAADDGEIIAGHGRLIAARKMGFKIVPVIRLSHLTQAQRRAYVIADNRLALDAGWDDEMLRLEIGDLGDQIDMTLTGFTVDELSGLVLPDETSSGANEKEEGETKKQMVCCPRCANEFDARKHKAGRA